MLEFPLIPLLVGFGTLPILLPVLWRKKKNWPFLFLSSVFWLYLFFALGATLFPVPVYENLPALWTKQKMIFTLSRVNLIPFNYVTFFNKRIVFLEIIRNILLTIPFGFGIQFFRRFKPIEMFWLALAPGLLIEFTQLAISLGLAGAYRGVDITDLILNTLGVWLGYGLFIVTAPLLSTYIPPK